MGATVVAHPSRAKTNHTGDLLLPYVVLVFWPYHHFASKTTYCRVINGFHWFSMLFNGLWCVSKVFNECIYNYRFFFDMYLSLYMHLSPSLCFIYIYIIIYIYINRLRYLRPLVLWIHHWPTHPLLSGMHPTAPINKRRNARRDVALADKLGCQVVVL